MSSAVVKMKKAGVWLLAIFFVLLLLCLLGWALEPKKPKTQIVLTHQDLAKVTFMPRRRDLNPVATAKGCSTIILPTSLEALAAEGGVVADCWPE